MACTGHNFENESFPANGDILGRVHTRTGGLYCVPTWVPIISGIHIMPGHVMLRVPPVETSCTGCSVPHKGNPPLEYMHTRGTCPPPPLQLLFRHFPLFHFCLEIPLIFSPPSYPSFLAFHFLPTLLYCPCFSSGQRFFEIS